MFTIRLRLLRNCNSLLTEVSSPLAPPTHQNTSMRLAERRLKVLLYHQPDNRTCSTVRDSLQTAHTGGSPWFMSQAGVTDASRHRTTSSLRLMRKAVPHGYVLSLTTLNFLFRISVHYATSLAHTSL